MIHNACIILTYIYICNTYICCRLNQSIKPIHFCPSSQWWTFRNLAGGGSREWLRRFRKWILETCPRPPLHCSACEGWWNVVVSSKAQTGRLYGGSIKLLVSDGFSMIQCFLGTHFTILYNTWYDMYCNFCMVDLYSFPDIESYSTVPVFHAWFAACLLLSRPEISLWPPRPMAEASTMSLASLWGRFQTDTRH